MGKVRFDNGVCVMSKEYECKGCPYHVQKFSEELGGTCMYIHIKGYCVGLLQRGM